MERLGRLLEMTGFSQRDLAGLVGVTEPTVQKWIGGGMPTGFSFLCIAELASTVPGGFELITHGEGRFGRWCRRAEVNGRGMSNDRRYPSPRTPAS